MDSAHAIFDRQLIDRRKVRAATGAGGSADFLLARAVGDIAERLSLTTRAFPIGLALGAYGGDLPLTLAGCPNIGQVIAAERSAPLAARCPRPRVVADEEALPFAAESLDLVASALSLQTVNDLPGALIQIRRALKPDGLFIAASLGGQTLAELREAFAAAELETLGGISPRVAPFSDVRDWGGLLQRAGFRLPVTDSDLVTVRYRDVFGLMQDLRAMGATNALVARRRVPLRRQTLARMIAIYHERFAEPDGRVRASFEIIHVSGWAPHESQQVPLAPGSAKMRLADALGTAEIAAGEQAPKPKENP